VRYDPARVSRVRFKGSTVTVSSLSMVACDCYQVWKRAFAECVDVCFVWPYQCPRRAAKRSPIPRCAVRITEVGRSVLVGQRVGLIRLRKRADACDSRAAANNSSDEQHPSKNPDANPAKAKVPTFGWGPWLHVACMPDRCLLTFRPVGHVVQFFLDTCAVGQSPHRH
jgi:hypothetical protein